MERMLTHETKIWEMSDVQKSNSTKSSILFLLITVLFQTETLRVKAKQKWKQKYCSHIKILPHKSSTQVKI